MPKCNVHHACPDIHGGQRRASDPLELAVALSHQVDAGNRTWVLSTCSYLLSCDSSHMFSLKLPSSFSMLPPPTSHWLSDLPSPQWVHSQLHTSHFRDF